MSACSTPLRSVSFDFVEYLSKIHIIYIVYLCPTKTKKLSNNKILSILMFEVIELRLDPLLHLV